MLSAPSLTSQFFHDARCTQKTKRVTSCCHFCQARKESEVHGADRHDICSDGREASETVGLGTTACDDKLPCCPSIVSEVAPVPREETDAEAIGLMVL
eukprot:4534609-Pleurochrysis_carterae.AAC.9